VQQVMDKHRVLVDRIAVKVNTLGDEHKKMNRFTENAIARLIHKNQTNFFTSQLNYVFLGWKAYMDRRRKCCAILSQAMRKTALQRTFTLISKVSRAKDLNERKTKTAAKAVRTYR